MNSADCEDNMMRWVNFLNFLVYQSFCNSDLTNYGVPYIQVCMEPSGATHKRLLLLSSSVQVAAQHSTAQGKSLWLHKAPVCLIRVD